MQSEVNIGTLGHVDHGKTSIIKAITGSWVDTHSEELKRGITIKTGFVESIFYYCNNCNYYLPHDICKKCNEKTQIKRRISFLDAPGHEMLMTTAIAASNIMDGVLLIIAANEKCPQPQTAEHLMVLDILGVKNIIVVQNKIDLVTKEQAIKNYEEIKNFLKGSIAENAKIIPVAANYNLNIDILIKEIENSIPTPKKEIKKDAKAYIARSFDINKPGTKIENLKGGVIGGTILQGSFKIKDEIEIIPGITEKTKAGLISKPVKTKIINMMAGKNQIKEAVPGGLIAFETILDPSITKNDGLVGSMIAKAGKTPKVVGIIKIKYHQFKRKIENLGGIAVGEILAINIGTATTVGIVKNIKGDKLELFLKRAICYDENAKMAISRKIGNKMRLSGYAEFTNF